MMPHKILIIFSVLILVPLAHSIEVDTLNQNDEPQTNEIAEIAIMKGELTVKIEQESNETKEELKKEIIESEKRTIELIEKRTNPIILNLPTIIFLVIIILIGVLLKARGLI